MAPQFVRGNKLIALKHPPPCVAQPFYMPRHEPPYGLVRGGDKLTVTKRKLGGWLRVKNSRTGKVTNLRVGPWLAMAKDVNLAVDCGGQGSQLDLMIRKSQNDKLSATIEDKDFQLKEMKMTNEKLREDNKWLQDKVQDDALVIKRFDNMINEMRSHTAQVEQELHDYSVAWEKAKDDLEDTQHRLAAADVDYQSVKNINQHLNGLLFEKDEEIENLYKRIDSLEQEKNHLQGLLKDDGDAVFV